MSKLVKYDQVNLNPPYYVCENREGKTEKAVSETTDAIIEKASRLSEKIIKTAEEKAAETLKKAYEIGYSEGYGKGKEQALSEAQCSLDSIESLFKNIDTKKSEIIKSNEKNIIKLAIQIAEKIINKELSEDEGAFTGIFKKAVEDLFDEKWIKLTVSEYETGFTTSSGESLLEIANGADRVDVSVNKGAPRGTCVVETESAVMDASVSVQLDIIEKALLSV
ncbi:MAG: FliH/SctL family protein [Oscillospiraceae bacterium]|nr:FliH/SctL family protein [Oscillospiraceae bacterium]